MNEYHKIQTVFNRDPDNNYKTLLEGEYSLPEFWYLKNNEWVFTEKVDGTNIRVILNDGEISFKGKTNKASIPPQLLSKLDLFFDKDELIELFPEGVCLYGEGYGAKIQSGGDYRQDQSFVLFDIKVGDWWLQRKDVDDIAGKLKIEIVPIIGQGTLIQMVEKMRYNFYSKWGNFFAEGIVARPETELKARNGNRIITKIKHRDFKRD